MGRPEAEAGTNKSTGIVALGASLFRAIFIYLVRPLHPETLPMFVLDSPAEQLPLLWRTAGSVHGLLDAVDTATAAQTESLWCWLLQHRGTGE